MLKKITTEKIADNIIKNKHQKISFKPGYDGVYGVPMFDGENTGKYKDENTKRKSRLNQKGLEEFM